MNKVCSIHTLVRASTGTENLENLENGSKQSIPGKIMEFEKLGNITYNSCNFVFQLPWIP
jgi:hypothetical protein